MDHRTSGAVPRISGAESTRKNGYIAHRMRAHNPTPRTYQTIDVLEVIAATIHIHKDARKGSSQDSGTLFVQVSVQITHKCISKPVHKRLKPGLRIVRGRNMGQRLRPVMWDAYENGGLRLWRRVLDNRKPLHHTVVLAPILKRHSLIQYWRPCSDICCCTGRSALCQAALSRMKLAVR